MMNLTLSVDERVLKKARLRAIEEETSVNARVREFLDRYASHEDTSALSQQQLAATQIIQMAQEYNSGGGLEGHSWTRDDLHER